MTSTNASAAPNVGEKRTRKWQRWKVDETARVLLEDTLQHTHLPDAETLSSLAVLLGKRPRQIQIWFQNKRQRMTPASKEVQVPVLTAVTACAYARAFAKNGSDALGVDHAARLAHAALATAPDPHLLAHDSMWACIMADAARISDAEATRDDAIAIAATAFLMRVASCCGAELDEE